jgi:nanoRNase/pAp phosphatase (c-di-AMP/oligoRNAs hydrolase)
MKNESSPKGVRLSQLRETAGPGPVVILTHDNPDPDALASGKALATLLKKAWNITSRLVYSGTVARADNRSVLKLLTPEWEHQDSLDDLDQYAVVALVDTQPGAGNNRLPSEHPPNIVIDHHHPIRDRIEAVQFADVQPEIGSTATMLYKYLEAAEITPDQTLATALFYGLKTDTRALSRGVSPIDEATYLKLLSGLDHNLLVQVENAGLDRDHFRAVHRGLIAARLFGQSIVARLGKLGWPDQGAEMADLLIRLENARAVLCFGEHEGTLHLSIRTKLMDEDAGQLIQRVVVTPGRAGGHGSMAGGQVPLLGNPAESVIEEIEARFLAAMGEEDDGEPLL